MTFGANGTVLCCARCVEYTIDLTKVIELYAKKREIYRV